MNADVAPVTAADIGTQADVIRHVIEERRIRTAWPRMGLRTDRPPCCPVPLIEL